MSPELIQVVSAGGAGVAVIVVTLIFLRFIHHEREQLMADRREERRDFLQRLTEVATQLELLTLAIRQMKTHCACGEEDRGEKEADQ